VNVLAKIFTPFAIRFDQSDSLAPDRHVLVRFEHKEPSIKIVLAGNCFGILRQVIDCISFGADWLMTFPGIRWNHFFVELPCLTSREISIGLPEEPPDSSVEYTVRK